MHTLSWVTGSSWVSKLPSNILIYLFNADKNVYVNKWAFTNFYYTLILLEIDRILTKNPEKNTSHESYELICTIFHEAPDSISFHFRIISQTALLADGLVAHSTFFCRSKVLSLTSFDRKSENGRSWFCEQVCLNTVDQRSPTPVPVRESLSLGCENYGFQGFYR